MVRKFGLLTGHEGVLRAMFHSMDTDGSGEVDYEELRAALEDLIQEYAAGEVLKSLDIDGDGKISFDEFKLAMKMNSEAHDAAILNAVTSRLRKMMKSREPSLKERRRLFNSMKSPQSGMIHVSTLVKALQGTGLEKEGILAWCDYVDTDMNGEIDFEEFSKGLMEGFKRC